MDEFLRVMDMLKEVSDTTNQLDYALFGGFWCMLLEEYCKANSLDIREASKDMVIIINQVQEEYGRY